MISHTWINEWSFIFRVADTIREINICSVKKWKIVLYSGDTMLTNINIKQELSAGDSISLFLFDLCLILLSLQLRKPTLGHQFRNSNWQINDLLDIDDLKQFTKQERNRFLNHLKMGPGNWHREIGDNYYEKRMAKSFNYQMTRRYRGESYKYVGILKADRLLIVKRKTQFWRNTSEGSRS